MKTLLLASILTIVVTAVGQTPTPTALPSPQTINAEDVKKARELFNSLEIGKKLEKEQNQPKTVADVLDKSVDLFASYAASLSDIVKKAAPELWRIMLKQQYVKAFTEPLMPLGFMILAFFWYLIPLKVYINKQHGTLKEYLSKKKESYGSQVFREGQVAYIVLGLVVPGLVFSVFFVSFVYYLSWSIALLINPEYYVLKDIIEMIK